MSDLHSHLLQTFHAYQRAPYHLQQVLADEMARTAARINGYALPGMTKEDYVRYCLSE